MRDRAAPRQETGSHFAVDASKFEPDLPKWRKSWT
jgi:hypothetical protein